jgi:kynurenine formamidase
LGSRWGTPQYRDELPRVSRDLALWCVNRQVRILGVEPPSVADVNNREEVEQIHAILLNGGVIIIEGLTNLEAISSSRVIFAAFPLKIKDRDGPPVRAVAIEEWDQRSVRRSLG